jgi:Skp family chaperone for outer membrane proteins
MKNLRLLVVGAVLLAVTFSASAQSKFASVDMKKLFNGYYKTKLAQAALDKDKADLRKEITDMAAGLEKAKADYKQLLDQANDQAISADERDKRKVAAAEKAKEVNSSQVAIEQFQRQAETQLSDKSQRMISNLLGEIQKAVADKSKAGGYTLVVNSANTEAFVYASTDGDITTAVLAQLNAGATIDVTRPATGLPFSISTNAP